MADFVYTKGMLEMLRGSATGIDWVAASIDMALFKVAPTEDKDDEFVADLAGETEFADASYSWTNLGTKTLAADLTNDRVTVDHGDVTFSALAGGEDIVAVTVQTDTGNDATARLIYHGDTFTSITTNGSDVVVSPPATGLFYLQV